MSILGAPFSFTDPLVKVTIKAPITMAIIVGKVMFGFRYQGAFSPDWEAKKFDPPKPREMFFILLKYIFNIPPSYLSDFFDWNDRMYI